MNINTRIKLHKLINNIVENLNNSKVIKNCKFVKISYYDNDGQLQENTFGIE